MTISSGEAISGEFFEREVGRGFSVEKFASMCNAIAWSLGRAMNLAQLSFTERVNVADNGIDGEWTIDLKDTNASDTPITVRGWNVFQYKKRDVTAQGRKATITALVHNLRGALKEIIETNSRQPNRYTLFTNVHLVHADKKRLENSIRDGLTSSADADILILGAAELSTFLNDLPHLRAGYFATGRFMTWNSAWEFHNRQKVFGRNVELVGRDTLLDAISKDIDNEHIQIILLSGPPQIGKSRLMLEASRQRSMEAVIAVDPESIGVAELHALKGTLEDAVIAVEDLDVEAATQLANAAIGIQGLKLILTVHTGQATLGVNFGLDSRLKHFPLQGISEEDSYALLHQAGAKFDYGVESWVVHQAGGNPGVLLVAAQVADMRANAESFLDQIARSLHARISNLFGERGLRAVRAISLLTAVGFRSEHAEELKSVTAFLGTQFDEVVDSLDQMTSFGAVRIRGSFLEVNPPLLAAYEAISALKWRATALPELVARLPEAAQKRLLRRLCTLDQKTFAGFWDGLFGKSGPLTNFQSALRYTDLLRLVAAAIPERVAKLVYEGLSQFSVEERKAIKGQVRRNLMWSMDELLFRRVTSEVALRSVALLAESENESFGNNATGVFLECFHPEHPQFPLPLPMRYRILAEMTAESESEEVNLLAAKAAAEVFKPNGTAMLRRTEGAGPLDSRPRTTYGEMWVYSRDAAELVWRMCHSARIAPSKEARTVLPRVLWQLIAHTPPLDSSRWCIEVTRLVIREQLDVSIFEIGECLGLAVESVDSYPDDHPRKAEAEEAAQLLRNLLREIDEADFGLRLQRWVGGYHSRNYQHDANGQAVFDSQREIDALALEAIAHPTSLDERLKAWLVSEEAQQSWLFFVRLGQHDEEMSFLAVVEGLAQMDRGARAFGAYIGGVGINAPEFVAQHLDSLTNDPAFSGKAILYATQNRSGDRRAVERIKKLISQQRLDAEEAGRNLSGGGWPKTLTDDDCESLLCCIAGDNCERAGVALDFLAMWIHYGKELRGDLADVAWRCLEAIPAQPDDYDSDVVAGALVDDDVDRAFRLLELLMNQPYGRKAWKPIDHHGTKVFWTALRKKDKGRLLRTLFSLNFAATSRAWELSWHMPDLIDWTEDMDVLHSIALESEKKACLVLEYTSREGLWPLAIDLLNRYPHSKRIKSIIASRAQHMQEVIRGPMSEHFETSATEIQNVLQENANISGSAKEFLEDLIARFRETAKHERRDEEDEQVNW